MSAIFEKALDEARIRGLQYVTLNTYPDKLRGLELGIWADFVIFSWASQPMSSGLGETDRFGPFLDGTLGNQVSSEHSKTLMLDDARSSH